jgi:hypothetical protein
MWKKTKSISNSLKSQKQHRKNQTLQKFSKIRSSDNTFILRNLTNKGWGWPPKRSFANSFGRIKCKNKVAFLPPLKIRTFIWPWLLDSARKAQSYCQTTTKITNCCTLLNSWYRIGSKSKCN